MFTACDEEYEELIYDEFHLQVAEGDLHGPSRVDIARAVQNEAIRYVGHADLQRLEDQTMFLHRRATSSPSGIPAAGTGTSRPGHVVPVDGRKTADECQ